VASDLFEGAERKLIKNITGDETWVYGYDLETYSQALQ
jgi:hypothetical protein